MSCENKRKRSLTEGHSVTGLSIKAFYLEQWGCVGYFSLLSIQTRNREKNCRPFPRTCLPCYKEMAKMLPNQLHVISTSRTLYPYPLTIRSVVSPYTGKTQKAVKPANKNTSFNSATQNPRESMNASRSTNLCTCSYHRISTSHNLQSLLFAPTKG